MVFTSALRQASKRVPLIKFRKGGPAVMSASDGVRSQATGSPAVSSSVSASQASPSAASARPVLEDWQLPPRYQRKPIDPIEMEYINRGGPPL